MTRKKVKLAFITNESSRKATYKKRKKGLLKKIDELSTLCGIEACAILYSPFDPEPELWPSECGVQSVLTKFRTMSETEQGKKMVSQESFLKERIIKSKEQMKKHEKENREKELTKFLFQGLETGIILHENMTMLDVQDLGYMIDQNLKNINRRLETLSVQEMQLLYHPQMITTTPTLMMAKKEEMTFMDHGYGFMEMNANYPMQRRQLFMDLLNGNGDETMHPFGDVNNLQTTGFWPQLFP